MLANMYTCLDRSSRQRAFRHRDSRKLHQRTVYFPRQSLANFTTQSCYKVKESYVVFPGPSPSSRNQVFPRSSKDWKVMAVAPDFFYQYPSPIFFNLTPLMVTDCGLVLSLRCLSFFGKASYPFRHCENHLRCERCSRRSIASSFNTLSYWMLISTHC